MISYAVVKPDSRDANYGYVLSTHHTLRRALAAQRKTAEALVLYYKATYGGKGSTISVQERFIVTQKETRYDDTREPLS